MVFDNEFLAIQDDKPIIGAKCVTRSANMIEVYGSIGLDFVWIDFEHGGPSPWNATMFENLVRAASVANTELLVRLPKGSQALIRKTLDTGVRNVLIPRVETATEVEDAVAASRFEYNSEPGERGSSSGRSSDFKGSDNFIEEEDMSTCIGVMIEKKEAVENIESICSVSNLGFVFIGTGDLSVQLGRPGQRDHPEVIEAVETVRDTALDADIPVGLIANDPKDATDAIRTGYQIVRIGDEIESTKKLIQRRLEKIEHGE